MWLINTATLQLVNFFTYPPTPPTVSHHSPLPHKFAILSHMWSQDASEEVTFQDMMKSQGETKPGYEKIRKTCEIALDSEIEWVWVDTCCIDKTSSAELSEAINSMFQYYNDAVICYVYLEDVDLISILPTKELWSSTENGPSRWFSRGWTLQELIAPLNLVFYASDWTLIATRTELSSTISRITNIDEAYLTRLPSSPNIGKLLERASVAERMSWASRRKTARMEDIAYCLLGIFQINMPLLYGEGKNSFTRLQEEIAKHSDDQSLFAWSNMTSDTRSILAASPADFEESKNIVPCKSGSVKTGFSITNKGLEITVPMFEQHALLECRRRGDLTSLIAVKFRKVHEDAYQRIPQSKLGKADKKAWYQWKKRTISLTQHSNSQGNFPDLPRYVMPDPDGTEIPYSISTSLADVSSPIVRNPFPSEAVVVGITNTDIVPLLDASSFSANWLSLIVVFVVEVPLSLKWGLFLLLAFELMGFVSKFHRTRMWETFYDHTLEIKGMSTIRLTLTMVKPPRRRRRCRVSLSQESQNGYVPDIGSSFLTLEDGRILRAKLSTRQFFNQEQVVVEVLEFNSWLGLPMEKIREGLRGKMPYMPEDNQIIGPFVASALLLFSAMLPSYETLSSLLTSLATRFFPLIRLEELVSEPWRAILGTVFFPRFTACAYLAVMTYRQLWYQVTYKPIYENEVVEEGRQGRYVSELQLLCVLIMFFLFTTDYSLFVFTVIVNVLVACFVVVRNSFLSRW